MTIDMGLGKKSSTHARSDISCSLSSSRMHKGSVRLEGRTTGVLEGRVVNREAEGPELL